MMRPLRVLLLLVAPASVLLALGARRADVSSADRCLGCHAVEAAAWVGSRHAVASTNPTFQTSFAQTRHPWCTRCHLEGGVGCLACHLGEGGGLVGLEPSLAARLVHPVSHDARLADERLCARCHQFDLPPPGGLVPGQLPVHLTDTPGQDTVEEWRGSAAAARGETCTSCHDPHAAEGAHAPALVREALTVDARRDGDLATFTLTARGAAHAVPTGDPFRRLQLEVCASERCEVPLATTALERRLSRDRDGAGWTVRDRRIPPATAGDEASLTVSLPLGEVPAAGARWRLLFLLADPRHHEALPPEESRYLVAEGPLLLESM
jgi:predicted CXXCH cytochrome family protein